MSPNFEWSCLISNDPRGVHIDFDSTECHNGTVKDDVLEIQTGLREGSKVSHQDL